MNAGKEPFAVPSPDRTQPMTVTPGMRVVRRPIYQALYSQEGGWVREMVDRIVVAKSLGFTAFEIDVTTVRAEEEKKQAEPTGVMSFSIFGTYAQPVIEGDEWKQHSDNQKKLRSGQVITIYALVVE